MSWKQLLVLFTVDQDLLSDSNACVYFQSRLPNRTPHDDEASCSYSAQHGSHWPPVAIEHLRAADLKEELQASFYFILITFKLPVEK